MTTPEKGKNRGQQNRKQKSASAGAPRPLLPAHLSVLDMILPPQTIPLFLLLIFITPIAILTAESLFLPIFDWFQALLGVGGDLKPPPLPFVFFVKLFFFILLGYLGCYQLLVRIKTTYYSAWSQMLLRPHILHVDYTPNENYSALSLLTWNAYRFTHTFMPPLLFITGFVLLGFLELYLFNALSNLPEGILPFQYTLGIFFMLMLGLLTGFSLINALWNMVASVVGEVGAVLEPDLPKKQLYQRCNRVAFGSGYSVILFVLYFLFLIFFWANVIGLLVVYDIQDVTRFQFNPVAVFGLSALTFALYTGLNYLKLLTYHYGVATYYKNLPTQLKDCFEPPPHVDVDTNMDMTPQAT